MADSPGPDAARDRWMIIQAVRLGGAVLILVGILIRYEVIPAPLWAGIVLMLAGLVDFFLLPTLLARRWRTPRQ